MNMILTLLEWFLALLNPGDLDKRGKPPPCKTSVELYGDTDRLIFHR